MVSDPLSFLRQELMITHRLAVAVYDHSLTLDREFEYFWKGRFNLIKVLWFAVRVAVGSHDLRMTAHRRIDTYCMLRVPHKWPVS